MPSSISPVMPVTRAPNKQVARLAAGLMARVQQLADELTERIVSQIDIYREGGPIPREDLWESCRDNLEFMFGQLGGRSTHDLAAPRRTGRLRAEQGAPLPFVQDAFRMTFAFMWDCLVAEAARTNLVSAAELVDVATDVWALNEIFTTEMADAYHDARTEQILRRDQERSALVEALLEGQFADTSTAWEAADLLHLPYQGLFVVVVAEATALARHALPNIESRLRARDIGSAWRLLPELQVGIVSLHSREVLDRVAENLRQIAVARVGVSPAYTDLEETPRSLHLARVALASCRPGSAEVSLFSDAPLPVLVVSSPTTSYRVADLVFGPLLQLPQEERQVLLDTLESYFAVHGSAEEAGKRLYCHRNTVRHRLKRIEQQTGRSLDDPAGSAELYVALQALRRLPDRNAEK